MAKRNGDTPLYQKIFTSLKQQLLDGTYPEGSQIPTEKELMNLFSTSRITVSRAVRELENAGYVRRLKAKGTFVNSRSYWDARKTQSPGGTFPFISVIFPAPVSKVSLNIEVLYGVEVACREQGYGLSVTSLDIDHEDAQPAFDKEKDLINGVMDSGALGAIILPYSTMSSPEMYNRMLIRAFPFVLIDRRVFGIEAPFVSSDNTAGFSTVVEHLIGMGHRKIAFVSGNTYETSSRSDRFTGYLQAMNRHRLPVNDSYIIHNMVPFDYNMVFYDQTVSGNDALRVSTTKTLEHLMTLQEPPTAIAATNDYLALYMMNIARSMGIHIPQELSITGFDNLPLCSLFTPRLTTMAQQFSEIGREAVTLLDKAIHDPQMRPESVQLKTKLIPGQTVQDLR